MTIYSSETLTERGKNPEREIDELKERARWGRARKKENS